jgi:hypothetical protein
MNTFEIIYINRNQQTVSVLITGDSAIVEENNFRNKNHKIISTFIQTRLYSTKPLKSVK